MPSRISSGSENCLRRSERPLPAGAKISGLVANALRLRSERNFIVCISMISRPW